VAECRQRPAIGRTGNTFGTAHRLNFATPLILHCSYANPGDSSHISRDGLAFDF
jgi:hypothetical protein